MNYVHFIYVFTTISKLKKKRTVAAKGLPEIQKKWRNLAKIWREV